jgi:hypothetical protein
VAYNAIAIPNSVVVGINIFWDLSAESTVKVFLGHQQSSFDVFLKPKKWNVAH